MISWKIWSSKGKCHKIFGPYFFSWFEPIWATDKQPKVFSNSVSISEIFNHNVISAVCRTPLRSKIFLNISTFYASNPFFHDRGGISSDCLFKSNHRQVKNLIVFSRCAISSALCCTPLKWCTPRRSLCDWKSLRNQTELENTSGCLSGAQMGSNHEKNMAQKSCDTLPLIYCLI